MSTMRGSIGMTDSAWRVVLVGRTGLDQALRRDPGFELIRARDAIDAIGELSDPIDHHSPGRTAVVVSPDAEPAGDEFARFTESLRRVDPGVCVIRVGEHRVGYDGSVARDADASDLRRALDEAEQAPPFVADAQPALRFREPEAPTPAPSHAYDGAPDPAEPETPNAIESDSPQSSDPHESAIAAVTPASPMPGAPGDDGALARALLSGHSVLEPAIAIARLRAGRDDLRYDAKSGRLTCADPAWSTGPGAPTLAALNAWLGSWVRLEAQHGELRHAAFTDPLTGSWNRRYFDRFMDAAINQARDARRTLTLMIFDIDNFKSYNDAYGHGAGDEILIETVRLLNSVIRPTDRVCRVGGDEFAVIFYEPEGPRDTRSSPPESIYGIATRFQKQICGHKFPKLSDEAAGTLTISGGLATFPWDGHNTATLLDRADQLSMDSKRQGKNALTFGQGAEKICHLTD